MFVIYKTSEGFHSVVGAATTAKNLFIFMQETYKLLGSTFKPTEHGAASDTKRGFVKSVEVAIEGYSRKVIMDVTLADHTYFWVYYMKDNFIIGEDWTCHAEEFEEYKLENQNVELRKPLEQEEAQPKVLKLSRK